MDERLGSLLSDLKVRGSIPGSNLLCSCHNGGSNIHIQAHEVNTIIFTVYRPVFRMRRWTKALNQSLQWSLLVKTNYVLSFEFMTLLYNVHFTFIIFMSKTPKNMISEGFAYIPAWFWPVVWAWTLSIIIIIIIIMKIYSALFL